MGRCLQGIVIEFGLRLGGLEDVKERGVPLGLENSFIFPL